MQVCMCMCVHSQACGSALPNCCCRLDIHYTWCTFHVHTHRTSCMSMCINTNLYDYMFIFFYGFISIWIVLYINAYAMVVCYIHVVTISRGWERGSQFDENHPERQWMLEDGALAIKNQQSDISLPVISPYWSSTNPNNSRHNDWINPWGQRGTHSGNPRGGNGQLVTMIKVLIMTSWMKTNQNLDEYHYGHLDHLR